MPKEHSFRRTKGLFSPDSSLPYRLSRSRLENFVNCSRCFYLDRRLGIEPPGIPAFTLNSAVDELLKKEFDLYRIQGKAHPLMEAYGIKAVPFDHPFIKEWRENFKGIQYHHLPTNFIVFGAVDDLWVDKDGQLFVVDYKATSTFEPISLDSEYRQAYKRQMEIYQWLLRKNNFKVSNTGYFVYCNGNKAKPTFDGKLEFDTQIITYQGNSDWVEETIIAAYRCLRSENLPDSQKSCPYCNYRQLTSPLEGSFLPAAGFQPELF